MKQGMDNVEILLVQELIVSRGDSNNIIRNNNVMWNEVSSLNLILEEMFLNENSDDKVKMCANHDTNKTISFIQWQCIENIKHIQELLDSIDDEGDEIKILLSESYPNIQFLLHHNQQQQQRQRSDSQCQYHLERQKEGKEDEISCNDLHTTKKDYLEMIDRIRGNLNSTEVLDFMDVIDEAFRLEANFLMNEIEIIRAKIDSQYDANAIGGNDAYVVHYDEHTLSEMRIFKTKLEMITDRRRLATIGRGKNCTYLPPLRGAVKRPQSKVDKKNQYSNISTLCSKKKRQFKNALHMAKCIQIEYAMSAVENENQHGIK